MKYYRDDIFIKQLGKRIIALRKGRNVTQEELAARTGFELKQIGRIERGEINTSISHIHAIAKALEIELKEMFDFDAGNQARRY
ncbi:helix-turn-helix transcriptional regulator (plasmid) [Pedobacter sp. BS3]|uniref:helix-turn-helix domain-containing protein n=1 Tax=Pedobacter sp. BS3 TaxID=2567937 RepID=UPI0011EE74E6|nr:helix-turn-helix transcriptional regulator [Pedobacter sp. BS3]TZF85864.1 helix-turn-helix transcriptional regulator [Pedobacter sp. BS3]